MSKPLARACLLAVMVTACGSSTPVDPSAPPAAAWKGVDPAASADTSTSLGVIEADDTSSPDGNTGTVQALMAGGGVVAFLGAEISSGGGCTLYAYATSEDGVSAGALTVSSTKQTLTLDPTGMGSDVTYAEARGKYGFATGQVTFSAAGGAGVGAFSETVRAPKKMAGLSAPAGLSRSTPADLTWTAESGDIAVYIFAEQGLDAGPSKKEVLRCTTTDTGAYTVSTAALSLVPVAYDECQIAVVRYAQKKVTVGDYKITLVVDQVEQGGVFPFD